MTKELKPATTMRPEDDTLHLPVRVLDVKASDHKWFGPHDLITLELVDDAGDLPRGLRLQLRRPHDGTADLRSPERRAKRAAKPVVEDVPVTKDMTKPQLLKVAKDRGVEVPAKITKADLFDLLS